MGFGSRRGKPVTVTAKSFGEDITLQMRPLSALETDQIRNAYPPPVAPREVVDGETRINDRDPDYIRQMSAWAELFFGLKVCRMLGGAAEFGTEDLVAQISLLKADFTEKEFVELVSMANKVGTGEITAADMEAAKERLLPFDASKQAGS